MKRRLIALAMILAGAAAQADPLEGTWKTQIDDGAYAHVAIAPCGANFCGTIARTFNEDGEYTSPNLGRMIVIDMTPEGQGRYRGKVWRPSNDKIYIGKVALTGDDLKLSGCIAGGLLCSKQSWTRLK